MSATQPKIVLSEKQIADIRAGRKTQHRVRIEPQPEPNELLKTTKAALTDPKLADELFDAMVRHDLPPHSPFGSPGSVLTLAEGLEVKVKRVWCERVQEISEEDAMAEGVVLPPEFTGMSHGIAWEYEGPTGPPADFFADDWDQLHGPGAWEKNEWVFVAEFSVTTPEQSQ